MFDTLQGGPGDAGSGGVAPKKDAFRDLLMRLEPEALDAALRGWITVEL